jgi:hypothetical protein
MHRMETAENAIARLGRFFKKYVPTISPPLLNLPNNHRFYYHVSSVLNTIPSPNRPLDSSWYFLENNMSQEQVQKHEKLLNSFLDIVASDYVDIG